MKFCILCPTLAHGAVASNGRIGNSELRERMATAIDSQIDRIMNLLMKNGDQVYLMFDEDDGKKTTGYKRNALIEAAVKIGCDAHAFLDDDDLPGETYVERAVEFMHSDADCAELWGQIYWSGKAGKPFHHFIDCKNPVTGKIEWFEDDQFYYRMPNHLNFVKTASVKDILFPDQTFGEDGKWSEAVQASGVLKTEFKIPEIIYHYFCGEPKHKV